jgi:hypothetical protein
MEKLPLNSFLELFDELYMGVTTERSWVIDKEPGLGFTGVIRTVSAEDASRTTHEGGTTVAAHTEHLRWSLNFALAFFQGKRPDADWSKSWRVRTVNEQEWENLRSALQNEYIAVKAAIESVKDWPEDPNFLKGVLALVPHAAYHLGSIKQLILTLKIA